MQNKELVVEFCRGRRCCPTVTRMADGNYVIGGEVEGRTVFTEQNFQDFVAAAKAGNFDGI